MELVGEEGRTAARAGTLSGAQQQQQQQPLGEVTAARANTGRAAGAGAAAAGMGAGKAGAGRAGAEGLKRKAPPPNANPFARKKANA